MDLLAQKAIQKAIEASLAGDFKKAIEMNKQILEKNQKDVEALNRLGCAYLETGQVKKAKQTYKKGLSFDRYNPIILKNLKKIDEFKGRATKGRHPGCLDVNNLFLTEPGKTKITSLVNLPASSVFFHLNPGTPVDLVIKRRQITICLTDDSTKKKKMTYLGLLPDDLAFRLLRLFKAGNHYQAYIKSVSKNNLSIFIKEVFRANKLKNQPSFLGVNNNLLLKNQSVAN